MYTNKVLSEQWFRWSCCPVSWDLTGPSQFPDLKIVCVHCVCTLPIGNVCVHMYTHTHTYIHTHIHTYTHTNTHIHTYIHTYKHWHTHIHTYTHTNTHTHIHTYIQTLTHTNTHTYIHTHRAGHLLLFQYCVTSLHDSH